MILICCALFYEAKPIIRKYNLRRNSINTLVEEYTDDKSEISLIITGVGSIVASAKVATELTFLCSCGQKQKIHLINIGSCAGIENLSERIFLINKITDKNTGDSLYPDMLYRINLPERQLITCSSPVNCVENDYLYDMEAYGIFIAGNCFLSPDRITFLKIVSDNGKNTVTPQLLTHLIENSIDVIDEIIVLINKTLEDKEKYNIDWDLFDEACDRLHCTVAMINDFKQLIKYGALIGYDINNILREMPETLSKKQGKEIIDGLKVRFI